MGTMLCSKVVPDVGGDTAFASMSAVYEGLSDRWQRFLSGLRGGARLQAASTAFSRRPHRASRSCAGSRTYTRRSRIRWSAHPVTRRKVLFVNPQFTLFVKGMAEDESRIVLDMLYRKTLVHEYQYRHRWQSNMLVFWDNRSVQHSALHDYYPKRR